VQGAGLAGRQGAPASVLLVFVAQFAAQDLADIAERQGLAVIVADVDIGRRQRQADTAETARRSAHERA